MCFYYYCNVSKKKKIIYRKYYPSGFLFSATSAGPESFFVKEYYTFCTGLADRTLYSIYFTLITICVMVG